MLKGTFKNALFLRLRRQLRAPILRYHLYTAVVRAVLPCTHETMTIFRGALKPILIAALAQVLLMTACRCSVVQLKSGWRPSLLRKVAPRCLIRPVNRRRSRGHKRRPEAGLLYRFECIFALVKRWRMLACDSMSRRVRAPLKSLPCLACGFSRTYLARVNRHLSRLHTPKGVEAATGTLQSIESS